MAELWLSTSVAADESGSYAVVTVGGDLDLSSEPILRAHLRTVLAKLGPCLALDLSDLTFMDSSGLSLLVRFWKQATAAGGTLRLIAPQPHVVRKLITTGLTQRLRVFPGLTEALREPLRPGALRTDLGGSAIPPAPG